MWNVLRTLWYQGMNYLDTISIWWYVAAGAIFFFVCLVIWASGSSEECVNKECGKWWAMRRLVEDPNDPDTVRCPYCGTPYFNSRHR